MKYLVSQKSFLLLLGAIAILGFTSQTTMAQSSNKGSSSKGSSAKSEALKVGDEAPDFEITTFEDAKVKLSERFGDEGRPVILLFSRANW